MTVAQGLRQIAYTLSLLVFLRDCTTVLDAQQPNPTITVVGSPKIQLIPLGGSGGVWIRVTVPRDERNRSVCVTLDSGTYTRSSCWENVGRGGAYRAEYGIRDLPTGEYLLVGELQWVDGANGERKVSYSRDKIIISSGEDF